VGCFFTCTKGCWQKFVICRAGKSTVLSMLGGLIGHTRGSVLFEGGVLRPPPGTIGIVPQRNVLFPELTCYQTLRVWAAVKGDGSQNEDLEQLLKDCDLGAKIHSNADTLSGGQKRKLQLAIGLVGGSKSEPSFCCPPTASNE
jgi:ATP-binding cassette, subfamily A (ABC1), member 3